MMSITGQEGGPPARVGVSIGDIASGLFATVAILAAIEGRHGSGGGAFIDVSMMDCQMALMENAISRYLNAGDVPEAPGQPAPSDCPVPVFRDQGLPRSRYASIPNRNGSASARRWTWSPCCTTRGSRTARCARSITASSSRCSMPCSPAAAAMTSSRAWKAADVPCSPINSIPEVARDPQVAHRRILVDNEGVKYVGAPFHYNRAPVGGETSPPALGADSVSILRELGRSEAQIADLQRTGVL